MARVQQSDKLSFSRYVDSLQLNPSQILRQIVKPRGLQGTSGMANPTNITWDIRSVGRNSLLDSKCYIRWVLRFTKTGGVFSSKDKLNLKDGLSVQQSLTDLTFTINGASHSVNQQDFLKPFLLQQGRKQFENAFDGTGGELDTCKETGKRTISLATSADLALTAANVVGASLIGRVFPTLPALANGGAEVLTHGVQPIGSTTLQINGTAAAGELQTVIAFLRRARFIALNHDSLTAAAVVTVGAGAGQVGFYEIVSITQTAAAGTAYSLEIKPPLRNLIRDNTPINIATQRAADNLRAAGVIANMKRIGTIETNYQEQETIPGAAAPGGNFPQTELYYTKVADTDMPYDKVAERRRNKFYDLSKFVPDGSTEGTGLVLTTGAGLVYQIEIWEPLCFPGLFNPFKGADPRCFDKKSPFAKMSSVIPNFNNVTISANFKDAAKQILTFIPNETAATIKLSSIQRGDIMLEWYNPPPSSKFQYPTNINLQSYSSQIYKKKYQGGSTFINADGVVTDTDTNGIRYLGTSVEQTSDYIRLDSIPNYNLFYFERGISDIVAADNLDRYPQVTNIKITINSKHNTLQNDLHIEELYEIYKRKYRYNDNVPYAFKEYSEKRCIICLTDEDLALVMGANIQNPTNITFNMTMRQTSHPGDTAQTNNWYMVYQPIYTNEYLTITPDNALFRKSQTSAAAAKSMLLGGTRTGMETVNPAPGPTQGEASAAGIQRRLV